MSCSENSKNMSPASSAGPPSIEQEESTDPNAIFLDSFMPSIITGLGKGLVPPPIISNLRANIQTIADIMASAVFDISQSTTEISNILSGAIDVHLKNINAVTVDTLASISKKLDLFTELIPQINTERFRKEAIAWGKFGWTHYEFFENIALPESQIEADRIARRVITDEVLHTTIANLKKNIKKHSDLDESLILFENRHYKSCCMMLFSLIDCELYKHAKKEGGQRRQARSTYRDILQKAKEDLVLLISASGTFTAYKHFFDDAQDFDRSLEADINRNFLMHGMRYKPVRRHHCVKLFLLLEETIQIINWV